MRASAPSSPRPTHRGCSPIPTGPWPAHGNSPPSGVDPETISLAFPTGVFRPGDREALRRRLGLPADDVLVLVSSVIVDGPDKGFTDLVAALQAVAGPGVGFVAVGRLDDPGRLGLRNLFAPGLVADEDELAAWYGACDLHVTASRYETLGQTPIEAGLCGVPTLAYRTAGLTSSVIDGVSGRLVPMCPGALAEALRDLVADPETQGPPRGLRPDRPGEPLQPSRRSTLPRCAVPGPRIGAGGAAPGLRPGDARPIPLRRRTAARRARHRPAQLAALGAPAAPGQADRARAYHAAVRAPLPLLRHGTPAKRAMTRRIYLDRTHLRAHVTGIERITLDLFAPDELAPHEIRTVTSKTLPGMIARQQFGLPLRALMDRDALFLFPGFPPGPLCALAASRCLLYVHDTFLLTRPEDLSLRSRLYLSPGFALAMRWARNLFVNSRTTGEALRGHCAPEARVALLRPRVRDVFGLASLPGPALYEPGMSLRMLALGTIEPRKDYAAALAVTAALNRAGLAAELHLVGRIAWGHHPFVEDPPPYLHLHGYLEEDDVRRLAGRSHLLLSTSKAEGLGLPLLEVQHGGMPVVAPDGAVFREVLGTSSLLIRTDTPEASAAGMAAWIAAGGLVRAAPESRANVARWNALAADDSARLKRFLADDPDAYAEAGSIVPAAITT